jgi:hypothetical protein
MSYRKLLLPAVGSFLVLIFANHSCLAQSRTSVVHVFVALADNQHQGIVPVPARLGNGRDPFNNLYWGAAFGVKSFLKTSSDWHLLACGPGTQPAVLERCVFRHHDTNAILVADAYDGARIRDAVSDFVSSVAGLHTETLAATLDGKKLALSIAGGADLLVYVGHDAFMDFQIPSVLGKTGAHKRQFIVLACDSKTFFAPYMRNTQSQPLLWTTGLMAPEAYTLKAALDGWLLSESHEAIRQRAAVAYDKYQNCGLAAAQHLFATGW